MLESKRTPYKGLQILEELFKNYPHFSNIRNQLINTYIRFGMNNKAIDLANKISDNKTDIQSLKFKAWLAHQKKDFDIEYLCWEEIFHKQLFFLPSSDRVYLMQQTIGKERKISLFKEIWLLLFNHAFSSLPIGIQNTLGLEVKDVILVANNNSLTVDDFYSNISANTLIICFNHNVFLDYHKLFPNNPKLLFFRKENHLNHDFLGLVGSPLVNDNDALFELMRLDNSYLLFNEHKPHTLEMPDDIYKKIYNPYYSSTISQFHRIFHYLEPMSFYFNHGHLTPTSGYMVFRYLYYARLYLFSIGKPSFTLKLLGFNFNKESYYPTHGVHNWEYERNQLENLPSSITRVIV